MSVKPLPIQMKNPIPPKNGGGEILLSFSPLPPAFQLFLRNLKKLNDAQVLDLGSGQGGFASLFAGGPVLLWQLDRLPAEVGVLASIRGDALNPPIKSQSLDGLLAGNLVHHLIAQEPEAGFLGLWFNLLKPGGRIFLFEDEPQKGTPAENNYKDLQTFLARLMPTYRGALLSLQDFLELAAIKKPEIKWESGLVHNQNDPDAGQVCAMLKGDGRGAFGGGQGEVLAKAIEEQGLSYGTYWWATAQKE